MRTLGLLLLLWGIGVNARAQNPVNYADWRLEWGEEFNTPLDTADLATRWQFRYPWGWNSGAANDDGYCTARELQTAGGVLYMTMHRLAQPIHYRDRDLHYTVPMLYSRHPADSLRPRNCGPDNGFSYGLFEVRLKLPKTLDTSPSFWLYGGAPDELNVFEGNANSIANNLHLISKNYWRPSREQEQVCQCPFYTVDPAGNLHDQFHTYGVSWLPNGVIFYFDGIPIRHETRLLPAGCPMSVLVDMVAQSWYRQEIDTMAVDYIRIYRARQLPYVPPVLRPGAAFPQTEQAWLPAETQPGLPDQGTHQTWQLAPQPRNAVKLDLLLTENYNPPCLLPLPLPVAGHWAPTWLQSNGMPELRVRITAADSVRWAVYDLHSQLVTQGTTAGNTVWNPRWDGLPPGTYALHLHQGAATMVHPLTIGQRPVDSAPTAEWQLPAPPPEEPAEKP